MDEEIDRKALESASLRYEIPLEEDGAEPFLRTTWAYKHETVRLLGRELGQQMIGPFTRLAERVLSIRK